MLKCIIIEDELPAQRILQTYIAAAEQLQLKNTFSDAVKAREYLFKEKIDLIFLDIHLPKISGLDFLKSTPAHPWIILTTAFSEYALESYEYNVADYLLKPFSSERFLRAVSKMVTIKETRPSNGYSQIENIANSICIKSGYDLIKVNRQEVLYIKSDGDYTDIVTSTKTHVSKDPLRYWVKELGATFAQVHKSYIVNTMHLQKVSGYKLYLSSKDIIPIGRTFKKQFVEKHLK